MTSTSIEATPITEAEKSRRAEYIKGLHAFADALEAHPDVRLPYDGTETDITTYFLSGDDPRAAMAAAARAFPCDFRKEVTEDGDHAAGTLRLKGKLHGLRIELVAYRTAVCERVVTGTREVTETVKDPEALAAVPEVEITKVVEDVVWECHSILAPSVPAQTSDAA